MSASCSPFGRASYSPVDSPPRGIFFPSHVLSAEQPSLPGRLGGMAYPIWRLLNPHHRVNASDILKIDVCVSGC